jgi:POT family proton-dependent oligopeptide transporter
MKTWLGHPRGLSTLFFTELWERFSYYGMRGILVLFLTDAVRGGFGMTAETAGAIYGLYTSLPAVSSSRWGTSASHSFRSVPLHFTSDYSSLWSARAS